MVRNEPGENDRKTKLSLKKMRKLLSCRERIYLINLAPPVLYGKIRKLETYQIRVALDVWVAVIWNALKIGGKSLNFLKISNIV